MLIKAWTLKRELKQQQFWATHVNRKWTFCTLGPWLWSNYQANHLHESNDTKQYKFGSIKGYSKVGWVWLSGWTLSWIVTDFSTTCAVVIFRVNWSQHHQSLSTTTVLFRTTFTRTIKLNLLLKWLLGSNLSQHQGILKGKWTNLWLMCIAQKHFAY